MDSLRKLLLIAACNLLVATAHGQYRAVALKTPSGGGWGIAIDGANAYGTSRHLPFFPTEHLLWSLETGEYRVDVVGSVRSMRGKWGSGGADYGFGPTALATRLDTLQIVILDRSPFHYSGANDTDGVRHVGSRHQQFSYQDHAMIWSMEARPVDLHPLQYFSSIAHGIDGSIQVGEVYDEHRTYPAMWRGSAQSMVRLPAPGDGSGSAVDVKGDQLIGSVQGGSAIWNAQTLKFTFFPGDVRLFETNGQQQVGNVGNADSGYERASVWSGTPDSRVDLHGFLPRSLQHPLHGSIAVGINEEGVIIGFAAINVPGPVNWKPVLWIPE